MKILIATIASVMIVAAMLIGSALLSGCKTLDDHSATVQLVVSQAAMRYIEQASLGERAHRAMRVMEVVSKVRAVAAADSVSIADLARIAIDAIPANLNPSDRSLAVSIVNIAAQELKLKIGEGKIPADALVKVTSILDAIHDGASAFVPR